jgi:hypothetical protein
MAALGQKRTYAPQKVMSAFLPIATVKADFGKPSCLLRTLGYLFDDLVGAGEH